MGFLFRTQAVILAIQGFLGLWIWLAPPRKVADPSKKLTAGCCYHSRLAAASRENWDYAQKRYSLWCFRLLLPSMAASVTMTWFLSRFPNSDGLPALTAALLIPLLFLFLCRYMTERDLKRKYL